MKSTFTLLLVPKKRLLRKIDQQEETINYLKDLNEALKEDTRRTDQRNEYYEKLLKTTPPLSLVNTTP